MSTGRVWHVYKAHVQLLSAVSVMEKCVAFSVSQYHHLVKHTHMAGPSRKHPRHCPVGYLVAGHAMALTHWEKEINDQG